MRKKTPREKEVDYLIERKSMLNKEWEQLLTALPHVYYQTIATKMNELNHIDNKLIKYNLREYLG